jgi:hypothetical protein
MFAWWPVAAVFAAALGLLGGMLAALVGGAVDRLAGKPPGPPLEVP